MTSKLDAISARLEAATPGPWESEENFSSTSVRKRSPEARLGFRLVAQVPLRYAFDHVYLPVAGHPDDPECAHRADGTDATYCGRPEDEHDDRNRGDADLIAHAPTDLAALLEFARAVKAFTWHSPNGYDPAYDHIRDLLNNLEATDGR